MDDVEARGVGKGGEGRGWRGGGFEVSRGPTFSSGAPLDIFKRLEQTEWDTLVFFYGVIMCVGGLGVMGYLNAVSNYAYGNWGPDVANVAIGLLSSVIDNIPMIRGAQHGTVNDQARWLLLPHRRRGRGVLSIGSAAGWGHGRRAEELHVPVASSVGARGGHGLFCRRARAHPPQRVVTATERRFACPRRFVVHTCGGCIFDLVVYYYYRRMSEEGVAGLHARAAGSRSPIRERLGARSRVVLVHPSRRVSLGSRARRRLGRPRRRPPPGVALWPRSTSRRRFALGDARSLRRASFSSLSVRRSARTLAISWKCRSKARLELPAPTALSPKKASPAATKTMKFLDTVTVGGASPRLLRPW